MEWMINTIELGKQFGKTMRVQNLNLQVPPHSIYGFLGPNGAGKTTTLKMLLGLVKPTHGKIMMFGKPMNSQNRIEILRQTGSLIETPSYYGHLSGVENLEIVCALKGAPQKEIVDVLTTVRLEGQKDKKVSQYSLGMKQRLGIAAALIGKPKILLLDEPTNGLDPAGIQEIRELICSLPQKYEMTVVVSSHLLNEMDQMATHVGIIHQGSMIFQDRLSVLHQHSKKIFYLATLDNQAAVQELSNLGLSCKFYQQYLVLPEMEDPQIAYYNRKLNEAGVGVTRILEYEKSLEDIFLDLIGKRVSL